MALLLYQSCWSFPPALRWSTSSTSSTQRNNNTSSNSSSSTKFTGALVDWLVQPSSDRSSSSSLYTGSFTSRMGWGFLSAAADAGEQQRKPRFLERNGILSPKRNSTRGDSSSSSSSSDGNNNGNNNTTALKEALVELGLTLGIALVSSYLLSLLTQRLLRGAGLDRSGGDSEDDMPAAGSVYAKLQRILTKRAAVVASSVSSSKNSNHAPNNHSNNKPPKVIVPHLTPRELQMADEILDPDEIESSFADIGGLDATKQEIYELAVLPLVRPDLFGSVNGRASKLVQPVKGILLYGKPGTGKTMLAKALAKESQAIFLPLQLSKILNKYWGESNKLIAATFSLAHKLQPAVIFIDELDTFLKNTNSETAFMDSIKAEFLTLWDGIATSSYSRVLVLGATNRPQHIDSAILRRMPRAFEVPLPNAAGRYAIFQLLLQHEPNVDRASVDAALPQLVRDTYGYSGSDLKEVCRAAAMIPIRERTSEYARQRVMGEPMAAVDDESDDASTPLRLLSAQDLRLGLAKVRRTGAAAQEYGQNQEQQQQQQPTVDVTLLKNLATLLRSMSQLSTRDEVDEIPNLN